MSKFETTLRKFADDVYHDELEIRSYSGRGMYGKTCLGVTVDNLMDFVAEFASHIGYENGFADAEQNYEDTENFRDFLKILKNGRTDNMGMSTILYWPNIPYTGTEANTEDDSEDDDA